MVLKFPGDFLLLSDNLVNEENLSGDYYKQSEEKMITDGNTMDNNDSNKLLSEKENLESKEHKDIEESKNDINDCVFQPSDLRRNPTVMEVISSSQKECLRFWTHKDEKCFTHERILFASKRNLWKEEHAKLYGDLLKWRRDISTLEQIAIQSVCSTEFLISIALFRPSNMDRLKRLHYFLPEILEDPNLDYLNQFFALVEFSLKSEANSSNTLCYKTHNKSQTLEKRDRNSNESDFSENENKGITGVGKEEEDERKKKDVPVSSISTTFLVGILAAFVFAFGANILKRK